MTMSPQPRRSFQWLPVLLLLGFAGAIAGLLDFAVYRIFFAAPAHDQSWYLYAAGRVLSGTKLYGPRLTETNPPLIIWFMELPSLLASWLHVTPLAALKLVVVAMTAASAAWVTRILRAANVIRSAPVAWLCFCSVLAIEGSLAANFGQREHLLVLLLAPYLLQALCGSAATLPLPERIALGAAAGVAICLKPQDAMIVVGLELFLLLWRRRARLLLRAELLALVLTGCLYLLLVGWLAPLYLHNTVPILKDTYWAFGEHSFGTMLRQSRTFELAALLTLVLWILLWICRRRALHTPLGLLVASGSAFVAYCAQHTGFSYQYFPQNALLAGALLWLLLDWIGAGIAFWAGRRSSGSAPPELSRSNLAALAALFIAVSLPLCLLHGQREAEAAPKDNPFLEHVVSAYPPGTPVYILSTELMGFDHVFRHNLVWSSRYAHLWMLPAIAQNEAADAGHSTPGKVLPAARVAQLAQWQRANTAADLAAWKPAVVLVERCMLPNRCQAIEDLNFDMLAWFLQSPEFAAQWSHYRRSSGNWQYDVYTRVD